MVRAIDITGHRYGKLVVIRRLERAPNHGHFYWECNCDCGGTLKALANNMRQGKTKSCGCERGEQHGRAGTREFETWSRMKARCYRTNHPEYKWYGAKGVSVCERWLNSFANFYEDMGQRPEGLSLDRINPFGNYEPRNCRWATQKEQQRNRRNNRILEWNGQRKCLAEWAEEYGLDQDLVWNRLKIGWTVAHALTRPKGI